MIWAEKNADWASLSNEIKVMLEKYQHIIPAERISDIDHYLGHGELSAAFEYLILEVMERGVRQSDIDLTRLKEVALFFDLNDENECMIDGDFWSKFQHFIEQ